MEKLLFFKSLFFSFNVFPKYILCLTFPWLPFDRKLPYLLWKQLSNFRELSPVFFCCFRWSLSIPSAVFLINSFRLLVEQPIFVFVSLVISTTLFLDLIFREFYAQFFCLLVPEPTVNFFIKWNFSYFFLIVKL